MAIDWATITDEYQIPPNFGALNAWGPDVAASMRAQITAVGVDGDKLYYRTRGGEVLGPFDLPVGEGGTDEGVAAHITAPGSLSGTAVDARAAQIATDLIGRLPRPVSKRLDARLAAVFAAGRTVLVFAGSSTTQRGEYVAQLAEQIAARWRGGQRVKLSDVTGDPFGDGVHVVNAGVGSTDSSDYLTPATRAQINALNPCVIFHGIGSNDWIRGLSPSTVVSNLADQIAGLSSNRPLLHVVVHQFERPNMGSSAWQWQDYADALQAFCSADPDTRMFVNVAPQMKLAGVGRGLDNRYGLVSADNIHLTPVGGHVMGDLVADELSLSAPYSTGWVDLSAYMPSGITLAAGNTGIIGAREGNRVDIRAVGVQGSFAGNTVVNILEGMPTEFCPTRLQAWGSAYGGTGTRDGGFTVRPSNSAGVVFATAQTNIQASISFRA